MIKMSGNPKISVIMSVYNGEKYLRETIESILAQTFSDFEFIIVNDSSTDNSPEIIKSYDDERIRMINNKKNMGLARSLNKALKQARGEYIARMDADDVSLSRRLEKQYEFMEEHKDIVLSGAGILYVNGYGRAIGTAVNPKELNTIKKVFFAGKIPCFHPTWIFRKELLETIKNYRNLPTSQDYDFIARILFRGLKVSNIDECLLKYRIHARKVGYSKNIYQIKLGKYIRKAFREGFLFENSKFSESVIENVIRTPFVLEFLHKISMCFFNKATELRRRGNPVFSILLVISVLTSPYQMYHVFNYLRRKEY